MIKNKKIMAAALLLSFTGGVLTLAKSDSNIVDKIILNQSTSTEESTSGQFSPTHNRAIGENGNVTLEQFSQSGDYISGYVKVDGFGYSSTNDLNEKYRDGSLLTLSITEDTNGNGKVDGSESALYQSEAQLSADQVLYDENTSGTGNPQEFIWHVQIDKDSLMGSKVDDPSTKDDASTVADNVFAYVSDKNSEGAGYAKGTVIDAGEDPLNNEARWNNTISGFSGFTTDADYVISADVTGRGTYSKTESVATTTFVGQATPFGIETTQDRAAYEAAPSVIDDGEAGSRYPEIIYSPMGKLTGKYYVDGSVNLPTKVTISSGTGDSNALLNGNTYDFDLDHITSNQDYNIIDGDEQDGLTDETFTLDLAGDANNGKDISKLPSQRWMYEEISGKTDDYGKIVWQQTNDFIRSSTNVKGKEMVGYNRQVNISVDNGTGTPVVGDADVWSVLVPSHDNSRALYGSNADADYWNIPDENGVIHKLTDEPVIDGQIYAPIKAPKIGFSYIDGDIKDYTQEDYDLGYQLPWVEDDDSDKGGYLLPELGKDFDVFSIKPDATEISRDTIIEDPLPNYTKNIFNNLHLELELGDLGGWTGMFIPMGLKWFIPMYSYGAMSTFGLTDMYNAMDLGIKIGDSEFNDPNYINAGMNGYLDNGAVYVTRLTTDNYWEGNKATRQNDYTYYTDPTTGMHLSDLEIIIPEDKNMDVAYSASFNVYVRENGDYREFNPDELHAYANGEPVDVTATYVDSIDGDTASTIDGLDMAGATWSEDDNQWKEETDFYDSPGENYGPELKTKIQLYDLSEYNITIDGLQYGSENNISLGAAGSNEGYNEDGTKNEDYINQYSDVEYAKDITNGHPIQQYKDLQFIRTNPTEDAPNGETNWLPPINNKATQTTISYSFWIDAGPEYREATPEDFEVAIGGKNYNSVILNYFNTHDNSNGKILYDSTSADFTLDDPVPITDPSFADNKVWNHNQNDYPGGSTGLVQKVNFTMHNPDTSKYPHGVLKPGTTHVVGTNILNQENHTNESYLEYSAANSYGLSTHDYEQVSIDNSTAKFTPNTSTPSTGTFSIDVSSGWVGDEEANGTWYKNYDPNGLIMTSDQGDITIDYSGTRDKKTYTYNLTGLTPGTTYTGVKVQAEGGNWVKLSDFTTADWLPPEEPVIGNVTTKNIKQHSVDVNYQYTIPTIDEANQKDTVVDSIEVYNGKDLLATADNTNLSGTINVNGLNAESTYDKLKLQINYNSGLSVSKTIDSFDTADKLGAQKPEVTFKQQEVNITDATFNYDINKLPLTDVDGNEHNEVDITKINLTVVKASDATEVYNEDQDETALNGSVKVEGLEASTSYDATLTVNTSAGDISKKVNITTDLDNAVAPTLKTDIEDITQTSATITYNVTVPEDATHEKSIVTEIKLEDESGTELQSHTVSKDTDLIGSFEVSGLAPSTSTKYQIEVVWNEDGEAEGTGEKITNNETVTTLDREGALPPTINEVTATDIKATIVTFNIDLTIPSQTDLNKETKVNSITITYGKFTLVEDNTGWEGDQVVSETVRGFTPEHTYSGVEVSVDWGNSKKSLKATVDDFTMESSTPEVKASYAYQNNDGQTIIDTMITSGDEDINSISLTGVNESGERFTLNTRWEKSSKSRNEYLIYIEDSGVYSDLEVSINNETPQSLRLINPNIDGTTQTNNNWPIILIVISTIVLAITTLGISLLLRNKKYVKHEEL